MLLFVFLQRSEMLSLRGVELSRNMDTFAIFQVQMMSDDLRHNKKCKKCNYKEHSIHCE